MRSSLRKFSALAASLALAAGCSAATQNDPTPAGEPTAVVESLTPAVLILSIDGLNPEALEILGPERLPHLTRLTREGTSTMNARSAFELTVTLPNHTGMMTGRGIEGDQTGTSVTFNEDTGGTLEATHGSYVPSIFDVAHDHGLATSLLTEKRKFRYLMRSWNDEFGAPDEFEADDGRGKIDEEVVSVGGLDRSVMHALARGDSLVFWHQGAPDRAGHIHTWLSEQYLEAVETSDRELGNVLSWLDDHPEVADRLTVIVTADHGGPRDSVSHSVPTDPANYTIPFWVWGRGVDGGTDLYDLNPDRLDPAGARPSYEGPQPIRNFDAADLALSLLDLPSDLGHDHPLVRVSK